MKRYERGMLIVGLFVMGMTAYFFGETEIASAVVGTIGGILVPRKE